MNEETLLSLLTGGKYGTSADLPTIPEAAHSYIDQVTAAFEESRQEPQQVVGTGLGLLDMTGGLSKAATMIEKYRLFGREEALKYINDLTKGFTVTNFNVKGKNWHGVSNLEYEERRRLALERSENPLSMQYPLTGCKNIIGS